MFYWILWDIQYTVKQKFSLSLYNVTLIPVTYYVIVFFTAGRLMSFFIYSRERRSPRAHSGRVYSLIESPRRAF